MHKNAYQSSEIRKSSSPHDDSVAAFLVVLFCLIPVISIVVAAYRSF